MPSLKTLPRCLALLLSVAALSGAVPLHSANSEIPETSGEELQDSSGHDKWHTIAKLLHQHIKTLRDEQFLRYFGETITNTTDFANLRIQTLINNTTNPCLSKNFNEDGCLKRIYIGLRTYREYLTYVERENLTAVLIMTVKHSITRLLNIIKDKLNDDQNQALAAAALPEDSAWTRRTVTHSILYNFEVFMAETSRAIHFMNKKNKGKHYARKEKQEG